MRYRNFNATILAVAFFSIPFVTKAQVIPERIEINAAHSLQTNQTLDMKASQTICIREGFKMAAGSSLRLMVEPLHTDNADDKLRRGEEIVVYPNPGVNQVIVRGFFERSSMTVFDASGNPAQQFVLNGTDPIIDVSELREGSYVLKILNFTTRFEKKSR